MANTEKNVKTRKPRTTDLDERLAMANSAIERLEKLNAERRELIAKTRAKLEQRENALVKSEAQLQTVLKKRERILKQKNRPVSQREAKAAEKAQVQALMDAIKKSGKSIEEVLSSL